MRHTRHYSSTLRCVRWLSRGKVLERFIELQNPIQEFLALHNKKLLEEFTNDFLIKASYLAETFGLYNKTNKRMQGTETTIMECKETLDAFVCKVEYRKNKLAKGKL